MDITRKLSMRRLQIIRQNYIISSLYKVISEILLKMREYTNCPYENQSPKCYITKSNTRFNAYDDLFSIRKQDDETLVGLGVRIEKAMQTIQNLRSSKFTIEQLDEELQCMALIRALPEEYRHLSSSLLLMDKLDKNVILQAFRSEELNRQHQVEL